MKITYKGTDLPGYQDRAAVINFNYNERDLFLKTQNLMHDDYPSLSEIMDGVGYCHVKDKDEYKKFSECYKKVKKDALVELKKKKNNEKMVYSGFVRKFDDLGRIVIPMIVRELVFGTKKTEGFEMEIFYKKNTIILKLCDSEKENTHSNI